MSTSNIRFSGFTHYLSLADSAKDRKVYEKNFRKVRELEVEKEAINFTPVHQGFKAKFPDGSFAYFHPFQNNAHHRVGSYKLSKLLKFNLSPQVKAVKLPESIAKGSEGIDGKKYNSFLGTLCDWIPGPTFHDYIAENPDRVTHFDKKNLIELYLFSLISMDSDFHDRNIIVGPETKTGKPPKLYAIDSEKTGAKKELLQKNQTKFPDALRTQIEGEDIPQETLANIKAFVQNPETARKKLTPYFTNRQVDAFINIAKDLLIKAEVPRRSQLDSLVNIAFMQSSKPLPPILNSPPRRNSSPEISRMSIHA